MESSSAYGTVLLPVMVNVTMAESVPPSPSEMTYSKVTVAVSPWSR